MSARPATTSSRAYGIAVSLAGRESPRHVPSQASRQRPREAEHLRTHPPRVLPAAGAVTAPAVLLVEALGRLVAAQHPQDRLAMPARVQPLARPQQQCATGAGPPPPRIHVQGKQLAGAGGVLVPGGAEGRKAEQCAALEGEQRARDRRLTLAEAVARDAVLGAQPVEVLIGQQAAVGGLPGAD